MAVEEKVARLSIVIDSSQSDHAVISLDRLAAVGKSVEDQTKKITAETRRAAEPIKSVSGAAKSASTEFNSISKTSQSASKNISSIGKNAPQVSQSVSTVGKSIAATKSNIDKYSQSANTATKVTEKLNNEFENSNKIFSTFGNSFGNIAGSIAAFLSIQEIGQAADEWTNLTNRLKLVTDSSESLAKAQQDVFKIAQEARAPLSETAELYQRIATNAEELKLNSQDIVGIVSTISKTLAISGASAASSQAALQQLGQAFASGVLRGEEFNSVMEQTPALARAIADGMGVTIGKLRELANDGKLTSDVVVKAIQKQDKVISESFSKLAPTISSALTTANNSFIQLVGAMDKSLGASAGVANALIGISSAMDGLAKNSELVEKALTVALAVAGGKAASSIVNLIKSMQATSAASKSAASSIAQKSLADEKSALSTLAVVKAEQQRAVAAVAAANAETAASKAIQISELNRLRSTQQALAAELALEQTRHKAQITDIGRQQSVARMAELRLAEVAIIKQLQVAETTLAATSAANSAKVIAALEARRIATVNLAAAETAVVAATGARSAAMVAMTSASTLGAVALTKVAAAGRGLLAILGGPVGLIVTLGLAATAFIDFGESAENSFDAAAAASAKADEKIKTLARSILANDLKINVDTASFDEIGKGIEEITKKIEAAEKEYERMENILSSDVPQIGQNQVTQENLEETDRQIKALTSSLGKLQKAQSGSRFNGVADAQKYLETLDKQNTKLQNLSEKEEAIIFLQKNKISQTSEIGKKILEQAAANDLLNKSKEITKKEDNDQISRQKIIDNKYKSYIESLQNQIKKVEELTFSEKLLFDIQNGRLNGIKPEQKTNLIALAAEVDAKKELAKVEKDLRKIASYQGSMNDELRIAKENYKIQLATLGLGGEQAQRIQERITLEQEFARKKESLLSQRNSGDINDSVYEEETKIIESALADRLVMQQDYYDQLDQAQQSWILGASAALDDYADRAEDVSSQVYTSLSGALEEMTQGFADAAAQSILWSENFEDAMKKVGASILENVLSALIELGARYAVNSALEIAGITAVTSAKTASVATVTAAQTAAIATTASAATAATAATTATQTAAAATTTAAWTPAATAASIGSFGTAAAIGLAAVIAAIALAKGGFKKGGYTGNMGTNDVAGVVHGKEFVFDAESTKRIGVGNLEKMRNGTDNTQSRAQQASGTSDAKQPAVVTQVFNITTSDADSFRLSQRQIMKTAKRGLNS